MTTLVHTLASRSSALVFLAIAGALMLFGSSSPEAFASGVWNFKLLQSLLLFLGAGLTVHLAINFQKQLFSARAGGWLLHAGLLCVIVGGVWNYFGSEAKIIEVIEGQSVAAFDDERIRLDSFNAFYKPGRHFKGAAASISVLNEGVVDKHLVHVNQPGYVGKSEILIDTHGFAPLLHFRDASGRTLEYAYISLKTLFKEKDGAVPDYQRSFMLADTDTYIHLDLKPALSGGLPTNPKLSIVSNKGSNPTAPLTLAPGQNAMIGEISVSFENLRYFTNLKISRDPGLKLLFFGMVIVLLGSLVTFGRSLKN